MLYLRYHGTTPIPIEAECIRLDTVAGKTPAEIAALPVQHGNTVAALGEFFHVTGDAADGEVTVEGDCSRVKWIGTGMRRGRLTIRGNVGMHLGSAMQGGDIEVYGSTGDWVGAEMRGGRIHVHGDAGNLVGAAYHGSRVGMRGGVILIEGKAGSEVGATMRRGLIAIGGPVGDFPGMGLIAGSLFLFGPGGARPGAGMKRGTIAFLGPPPPLLDTFRPACTYQPVFITLYLRQLRAWGFPVADRFLGGHWRRYAGDLLAGGKGEILAWGETALPPSQG